MAVTEEELNAKASAPRVTAQDIERVIIQENYFTGLDGVDGHYRGGPESQAVKNAQGLAMLTFCVLTLQNGFTVTGQSAAASPANYNKDIGQRLAKEDAVKKIWPFLGYELRTKLHLMDRAGAPTGRITTLGTPAGTYVGTKVVHAIPMTKGEYNKLRKWEVPPGENPEEKGYLVQYTDGGPTNVYGFDGYISWTPENVFERAYNPGLRAQKTTYVDRLKQEETLLNERLQKLNQFIGTALFNALPDDDRRDLQMQRLAMTDYSAILRRRMSRAAHAPGV